MLKNRSLDHAEGRMPHGDHDCRPSGSKRPLLDRVSLTGPDDATSLDDLARLSGRFPFVEWALLYVPHNEGAPRNPTRAWREAFFDAHLPGYTAVHLCGSLAFEQLLQGTLPADVLRADRLQLNINARKTDFSDHQVLQVYRRALDEASEVILQYHAGTAALIQRFLAELPHHDCPRVHVLLDESRGTGQEPSAWRVPQELGRTFIGHAGGIGPDNTLKVLGELQQQATHDYWIDMESGIRTDNVLDERKAELVLEQADTYWQPHVRWPRGNRSLRAAPHRSPDFPVS